MGVDLDRVSFRRFPTNRIWARDFGPDLRPRRRGAPARLAIARFRFNAWAKYPDWKRDDQIPERAAAKLRLPLRPVRHKGREVVLEGGAIDVNGGRHAADHRGVPAGSRGPGAKPRVHTGGLRDGVRRRPGRQDHHLAGQGHCRRRHPRPRRRPVPLRRPQDHRAVPGGRGRRSQPPHPLRELGAPGGRPAGGRQPPGAGCAAHAGAGGVPRPAGAGQLRQLLHRQRRRCWCPPSTIRRTAWPWESWAS